MSEWMKDLIGWLILTAIIFALTWQLATTIGDPERHLKVGGFDGEIIKVPYPYINEVRTITV